MQLEHFSRTIRVPFGFLFLTNLQKKFFRSQPSNLCRHPVRPPPLESTAPDLCLPKTIELISSHARIANEPNLDFASSISVSRLNFRLLLADAFGPD